MRSVLIGTGFYSNAKNADSARSFFFGPWLRNTDQGIIDCLGGSGRLVVVDNSETELDAEHLAELHIRRVRIDHNLGHVSSHNAALSQFNGWSMSWIIPAMIAYSENCDFVYKEQDCLAFGDWLPQIRIGRAAFGNHWQMECEQSLFFLERDFIPQFVQVYLSIPEPDCQCLPERKFRLVEGFMGPESVKRFSMGVGRNRPLPADLKAQPWYAQKLTENAADWDRVRAEFSL